MVAEEEKYYRVDYGPGFPALIRKENLELFDGRNPLSEPQRSFVPPVLETNDTEEWRNG